MNSIFTRRSIRKYLGKEVPSELIEKIISAGMAAPSAGNEQPWHFIIIKDREILNEFPKFHEYAQMLKESPVAVVVCGDLGNLKYDGFWQQDVAAAIQNMLLEVTELGLGSVWVGLYPNMERVAKVQKMLNMPENVMPVAVLPIGYPGETKDPADRFDKSRVHSEQW